jgi:hypothetical protein
MLLLRNNSRLAGKPLCSWLFRSDAATWVDGWWKSDTHKNSGWSLSWKRAIPRLMFVESDFIGALSEESRWSFTNGDVARRETKFKQRHVTLSQHISTHFGIMTII